jgi:hypothetical protein
VPRNVAAGLKDDAVTVSSSTEQTGYSKNYLTDGILTQGWCSNLAAGTFVVPSNPSWVQLDFGDVYTIGSARFYPYLPDTRLFAPRDIEILTSTDGVNFSSSGTFVIPSVRDWTTVNFPTVDARFIKVMIYTAYDPASADARNVHIRELEVYNASSDQPALTQINAQIGQSVLDYGKTTDIKVTGTLSDGSAAEGLNLSFSGYDNEIVSVSAEGDVTALKIGSTVIQIVAEYNGTYLSRLVPVTVQAYTPASGVYLDKSDEVILTSEKLNLKATIQPKDASVTAVIWKVTGDPAVKLYQAGTANEIILGEVTNVLSVDAMGLVKGESLEIGRAHV